MRASRTNRQAQRRGTVPGGNQAPCAKRGSPPAGEEHQKYPGQAKGDVAGAKWLAPRLFARGPCSDAKVSCRHALEGGGEVKRGLLACPVWGWLSGALLQGCRGPRLSPPLRGIRFRCGDTRFPLGSSGHPPVPSPREDQGPGWSAGAQRVSQGADQQEERSGGFPLLRSRFSPCARLGPQVRLTGQGRGSRLKGDVASCGAGQPREAETSSVKHIPPAPRSPCQGTFNPLFDGRPRKYFFHILNLLAPVNHLNLLPLRTHAPMSFPSLAAVKDAATLFAPAFGGKRTAINYDPSPLSPRWGGRSPHLVRKPLSRGCPASRFEGGCT